MKKNIKNSARAEGGLALNVSMCVNIRHSCFLILIIYIFQFQFFYTFYFFTCFKLALSSRPLCILHRGYLYVSKRTGEAKLKIKIKVNRLRLLEKKWGRKLVAVMQLWLQQDIKVTDLCSGYNPQPTSTLTTYVLFWNSRCWIIRVCQYPCALAQQINA